MTDKQRKKEYQKKLPQIVSALIKGYKPKKIILFGSMANSRLRSHDIDLFMVKDTPLKRLGERAADAEQYIPQNDIPIDLIVYTPEEVKRYKKDSILLHQVFNKGKTLYG